MRPSRGMGVMKALRMPRPAMPKSPVGRSSMPRMPTPKTITRTDNPDEVTMYAKGGKTKWIQKAIKKPGALREQLGVPKGEKIPAKKLAKAAKAPGKLGQRARFAQTLAGMRKK